MVEMVHLIFAQLEHLPDSRAATPLAHNFTPRLQVRGRRGGVMRVGDVCWLGCCAGVAHRDGARLARCLLGHCYPCVR